MSLLSYLKGKYDDVAERLDESSKDVREDISEVVSRGLSTVREDLDGLTAKLKGLAFEHTDEIFAILRRIRPIVVHKDVAIITRFDDVQEVLALGDVFQTLYEPKLQAVSGRGAVGGPNTAEYMRDASLMRLTFRREDIEARIAAPTLERAAAIVDAAEGTFDLVADLAGVLPLQVIGEYIGLPDPQPGQLACWAESIFRYVFGDINDDPAVSEPSLAAAAEFAAHVDATIAARKLDRRDDSDVLGRLLRLQELGQPGADDLSIRSTLMIYVYGTATLMARSAALALDELFRHPEALAKAQRAARAGELDTVRAYVWEALRLNPINPGLFRRATEDYRLSQGNRRVTLIPKGTLVFASLASAMVDSFELDDATSIRVDRPDYHYMHFGHGLHECFGRFVGQAMLPRLLIPVLARADLRRAEGDAGELEISDGFYPRHLRVEFGPSCAS